MQAVNAHFLPICSKCYQYLQLKLYHDVALIAKAIALFMTIECETSLGYTNKKYFAHKLGNQITSKHYFNIAFPIYISLIVVCPGIGHQTWKKY